MIKTLCNYLLSKSFTLSLGFWLSVFAFFSLLYPYHLNFHEQYQFFLFSWDYLFGFLNKPGGISDYFGNFLTQFYFYSWIGAIIIATLLTALQKLVWLIIWDMGSKQEFIPLSFIPSILYWSLFCDENYLIGGLIAIIWVSLSILIYTAIKSIPSRIIYLLILIPLSYWFSGGAFLLLPLYVVVREILVNTFSKIHILLLTILCLLFSLTIPLLSKYLFLQYPMTRIWLGVNYFRFPATIPVTIMVIGFTILFLPLIVAILSKHINKYLNHLFISILLILSISGGLLIYVSSDMQKEEIMAYDFNVRMRRWERVIEMSQKKNPSTPLSVCCLNLALAKQGVLADRMFEFYQNGEQGLIPNFIRDYTVPMVAGEVYYHIGFINTSQRYAFEAMEALPDYQKSVRAVKRLAETSLINGEYVLSKKYLAMLEQTFYYSKWARLVTNLLNDEKAIDNHPEFGLLRSLKPEKDFLFSEGEKDMMLGTMFVQNPKNRLAYEYLMAYCLLNKDLEHFNQYYPMGYSLNYKMIPKGYQEALFLFWELSNKEKRKKIPYPISNIVMQRFVNYARLYNSHNNVEQKLKENFSDTYWYYLHFRNLNTVK